MSATTFRCKDPAGRTWYGTALGYAGVGYLLGFASLFHGSWVLNVCGMLLLAHAMVIAAYLIHECAHNAVFHRHRDNAKLGEVLSWLCGASYGTYEDMRYKHFRHHVDNDDVVCFDYEAFFERHPLVTKIIQILEWFYIPAHDLFVMHGVMVFTSFVIPERRSQRLRNLVVIAVRGGVYLALLVWFTKVAILYAIAYMLMVHVLRFMDSMQHDYGYHLTLYSPTVRPPHKGDTEWEQEHTFSPMISRRYPVLNLLVLNFCYHNAHHADMNVPFFRLPELHRTLTDDDPNSVIPLWPQLKIYHRSRVRRVWSPQPADYPQGIDYLHAAQKGVGDIGGNAASFLTSF